jgi:hypothetical protein
MPWPEPNVIGSELVVNGDFSTDSDWTKGTGWTISGGQATHSGSAGYLSQDILTVGKVYKITFDIVSLTNPATDFVQPYLNNSPALALFNSVGTHTIVGTALSGSLGFALRGAGDISIDNVSVREIDPLSVSIQMQGRMTRESVNDSITAMPIRWTEDGNNQIRIWHDSSIAGNGIRWDFVQEANNVIDQVSSGYINPFGILVPFNIASRHGSTFINGAVDGTALTANTTPTALPDLSSTDFNLAYDYMGTISMFRVWADDLADVGIAEATEPSEVPSLQLTFDNSETSFTIQDWEQ